jgi:hypothetical protein
MKYTILQNISTKELAQKVSPEYRQVAATLSSDKRMYTAVLFHGGRVITSRFVEKAFKRLPDDNLPKIVLGHNFTVESVEYLDQYNPTTTLTF